VSENKIKILIVSVGSLVGQNILDALEFSECYRRNLVRINGTNSLALTANNFRCDECYLVPPTVSDEYPKIMKEIIRKTRPDLILSARDADTFALKKLKLEDDTLPGQLPYGSLNSVNYALDKWESNLFCKKYQLPFADSFIREEPNDIDALAKFIKRTGYPIVAKPIKGFASKGVFFIRSWEEAIQFYERSEYMLQEYLGKADDVNAYLSTLNGPKPLFTETPGCRIIRVIYQSAQMETSVKSLF